jgi:hypothetical protein
MLQKLKLILLSTLFSITVYGQDLTIKLNKNAVPIEKTDSSQQNIFNLLNGYSVIMIGEIHGTNEPISFVETLVEIFTRYGDSVQVGFEIPSSEMIPFIKSQIKSNLLKTTFFAYPTGDGRASLAWFNAMVNLSNNKKTSIFFFEKNGFDNRNIDSVMYSSIKTRIKKHRNWKTITICGGSHNKLFEKDGLNRIGSLLIADKELNMADSVCSLNHVFKEGETLWNSFKPNETIYSKIGYDNYLYLYPKSNNEPYTGIFYTKYLTKSNSAILK